MITIKQDMIVFAAPEAPVPVPDAALRANDQTARRPKTIELPNLAFDQMLGLTEAELKVLIFIVRQTAGYGRESVTLTCSQIAYGTYGDDGRLLDRGTGLCLKSIYRAARLLTDKGYLCATDTGRVRRNTKGNGTDPFTATGNAAIYELGQRLRPVRNWIERPQPKPVPEARYGLKKPMAA